MSGSPWRLLGIARTADQSEIRRAYTRKLKAIDVDADPAGFVALREAFEAARWHAAQAAAALETNVEAEHAAPAEVMEATPEVVAEAEPAPAPERPAWLDDVEAIQALIFGEASREEIFDEVRARSLRLLNGPEMADIDHAFRVEQWAADVILSGVPRSNGLLIPAIDRFGWIERYGKWDCHPRIQAVIGRYMDVQHVLKLEQGEIQFARTFRMLKSGAPPQATRADEVESFLQTMAAQHPTVLNELPRETIEAWQALIAARHARPIARAVRRFDAGWAAMKRAIGTFVLRYNLRRVFYGLWIALLILLGIGFVLVTGGAGAIGIAIALANRRKT